MGHWCRNEYPVLLTRVAACGAHLGVRRVSSRVARTADRAFGVLWPFTATFGQRRDARRTNHRSTNQTHTRSARTCRPDDGGSTSIRVASGCAERPLALEAGRLGARECAAQAADAGWQFRRRTAAGGVGRPSTHATAKVTHFHSTRASTCCGRKQSTVCGKLSQREPPYSQLKMVASVNALEAEPAEVRACVKPIQRRGSAGFVAQIALIAAEFRNHARNALMHDFAHELPKGFLVLGFRKHAERQLHATLIRSAAPKRSPL